MASEKLPDLFRNLAELAPTPASVFVVDVERARGLSLPCHCFVFR